MSPEQIDEAIRRWLKAELDKDELARTNTAFAQDHATRLGVDVKVAAADLFGSDAAAKGTSGWSTPTTPGGKKLSTLQTGHPRSGIAYNACFG